MSFHFILKDCLQYFPQHRSTAHERPQLLSGNVFISSSFMKDSFARYRILGVQPSPPFRILNTSSHPSSKVSIMRNQLLILLRIPCQDKLLPFCCFQNSVFGFQQFAYIMSQCGSLSLSCLGFTELRCVFHIFIRFGKFSTFISSNTFSAPFFLFLLPGLL